MRLIIGYLSLIFSLVNCIACLGQNSFSKRETQKNSEIEIGFLSTQNITFKGYHQGNATDGWKSSTPTFRYEWWNRTTKSWNFGGSIQPVYFNYHDTLRSDLNYKGKIYHRGESAQLTYQFHNATLSANYPLWSNSNSSYFRIGGTLIYRYADVNFRAEVNHFRDKNFIIFPLINTEFNFRIYRNLSIFSRADFLPSLTQNVFLDGLFNVYFGLRTNLVKERKIDLGTRLFFGGFDENKPDDYANRTFFIGTVARYSF